MLTSDWKRLCVRGAKHKMAQHQQQQNTIFCQETFIMHFIGMISSVNDQVLFIRNTNNFFRFFKERKCAF